MSQVKLDIYNFANLEGVVTRVVDGDTVDVDVNYNVCVISQRVRLQYIDAPEKTGTTRIEGNLACLSLSKLLPIGSRVKVSGYGKDLYGRLIGRLKTDQFDISQFLLEKKICKKLEGTRRSEWSPAELYNSAMASSIILSEYNSDGKKH